MSNDQQRARRRPLVRSLLAALAGLTLLSWAASPAGAAVVDLPVASWEMGDGSRTLWDSSGNGLHGTVGNAVVPGPTVGGAIGLTFPEWGNSSVNAQRLVTVPHHEALNPGSGNYAFTVRFHTRMTGQNLIQKGQAGTAGGMFKLETSNGRAFCVFRGPAGTVAVGSPGRVDDGSWRILRCQRAGDEVAMWINGALVARRSGSTGHIANSWPVTIGGKPQCNQHKVGCDYFGGVMDFVRIDRPGAWVPDPTPAPAHPAVVDPGPVVK